MDDQQTRINRAAEAAIQAVSDELGNKPAAWAVFALLRAAASMARAGAVPDETWRDLVDHAFD